MSLPTFYIGILAFVLKLAIGQVLGPFSITAVTEFRNVTLQVLPGNPSDSYVRFLEFAGLTNLPPPNSSTFSLETNQTLQNPSNLSASRLLNLDGSEPSDASSHLIFFRSYDQDSQQTETGQITGDTPILFRIDVSGNLLALSGARFYNCSNGGVNIFNTVPEDPQCNEVILRINEAAQSESSSTGTTSTQISSLSSNSNSIPTTSLSSGLSSANQKYSNLSVATTSSVSPDIVLTNTLPSEYTTAYTSLSTSIIKNVPVVSTSIENVAPTVSNGGSESPVVVDAGQPTVAANAAATIFNDNFQTHSVTLSQTVSTTIVQTFSYLCNAAYFTSSAATVYAATFTTVVQVFIPVEVSSLASGLSPHPTVDGSGVTTIKTQVTKSETVAYTTLTRVAQTITASSSDYNATISSMPYGNSSMAHITSASRSAQSLLA